MKTKKVGRPKMTAKEKRVLIGLTFTPETAQKIKKLKNKSHLIEELLLKFLLS